MVVNILHVSDLHRDLTSPIGNQALLDSLERDWEQYALPDNLGIQCLDLIMVSGDIVQGVQHGTTDAISVLRQQYGEALDFLTGLADRFVKGNKEAVVVVPGNHDVSDHHVRESLEQVCIPDKGAKELVRQLFGGQSNLRWSWDDLALYKIVHSHMYADRFQTFASFYEDFYDGKRTYSTDESKQFDIFDYQDLGITIAGFSSCSHNDLLNRAGAIHPDSIAGASNELRKPNYQGRLRIAMWHHHIEGPPSKVDYMDPDIVQNLAYRDFSIGLHGHQHKPQYLDFRFRYGSNQKITLISAGTLCGGAASGFKRSYNLIQLDLEQLSGRLHVREMQNDNLQLPIWGQHSSLSHQDGTLHFKFCPPPLVRSEPHKITAVLSEAERFHSIGEFRQAAEILLPLKEIEELVRPILLDCLRELRDSAGIIVSFNPPQGSAEEIAVMDALWIENERERLAALLASPSIANTNDLAVAELRDRFLRRLER